MTFISYAQNFEDVVLWRALKHVKNGFYIDVGANDPEIDSVTKAFYDRGWSGINVEPIADHFNDLQEARLRDVNLRCVASSYRGEMEIWESQTRGWATTSKDVIALHTGNGFIGRLSKVPALPLIEICLKHVDQEIHFLKIDVEGSEDDVINSMDFSRIRPWILLIESTIPNTTVPNYDIWEEKITGANYIFAYSDGINRYYVAKEHSELLGSLQYPPNVFDSFILSQQHSSELRAQESNDQAKRAANRAIQAEDRAMQAEKRALKLQGQYNLIISSTSWRVTAPLRRAVNTIKWIYSGTKAWLLLKPGCRPRRMLRGLILRLKNWIVKRPSLLSKIVFLLGYFPRTKNYLKKFQYVNSDVPLQFETVDSVAINHRSPSKNKHQFYSARAVQLYNILKRSNSHHHKETK
jgi:FkbM family methyltransferase